MRTYPATYPDLARRILRKIEQGRGINLSTEDLDLMVQCGAIEVVLSEAASIQRQQSAARQQEREKLRRASSAPTCPSVEAAIDGHDVGRARTLARRSIRNPI